MNRLDPIVQAIIIIALIYAFGSWTHGIILAYQWITCNPHM
jgi:hypothetical protein